jgi:hypothetical protein
MEYLERSRKIYFIAKDFNTPLLEINANCRGESEKI